MEKFFCHKKVKILVLKKEQGKNLYWYNKWETELNVCKKWPEQCGIKHVNCEATIEFLWLWIGLTLRFSRVDKNNRKDHPLHLRRCLLHIHLFIFFKLLNLYAKFLYLKMTWGGEKISHFYCWFLFHNVYQRNFLLEKVKNYFPQNKVTTHCSLHPVANWFGIWGKRSHWPCVLEGLLLWGKSWVRLFILVTFILFLFSCLANHKARNSIKI